MNEDVVTTGVDDLLHYLQGKDKVALQDVASVLNVSAETVQAWVDFLVEEKILGIEYKFTKPFIYLNKEETKNKGKMLESATIQIEQLKKEFEDRAVAKQIPQAKIRELWLSKVQETIALKKEYFVEQAKKRNAEDSEALWQEYKTDLISRC